MRNPNRTAKQNRKAESGGSTDTIVVCSGKHDTSLQYAKWLAEALSCDGMSFNKQTLGYVTMYRNVVYIGALRDGDISNLNILWQNYNNFGLEGRNLFICAVGIGDTESRSYIDTLRRRNGCEGLDNIDFFVLPGRINRNKLKMLEKTLYKDFVTGGAHRLYEKEDADTIVQRAESGYDGMRAAALEPVINRIMELN